MSMDNSQISNNTERSLVSNVQNLFSELDGKTTLVAVTKKRSVEDIQNLFQMGVTHFGENRVDEIYEKSSEVEKFSNDTFHWHFIGHLQSNKIKKLLGVRRLSHIHSVDSLRLLINMYTEIEKVKDSIYAPLFFFLQVNTSGEKEKQGFVNYDEIKDVMNLIKEKESLDPGVKLRFRGLMTMSSIREQDFESEAKKCFQRLTSWKINLSQDFQIPLEKIQLSMGMSDDYHLALDYNTDFVRIGRKLFR